MARPTAKTPARTAKHADGTQTGAGSTIPAPRLLPWQMQASEQLQLAWRAGRLPHALLVQGAEGVGKRGFAAWLACAVLCDTSREHGRAPGAFGESLPPPIAGSPDDPEGSLQGCGHCASCLLIHAGSHPDLAWVAPEEGKQQISVEQVRAAIDRLAKTSYRQGYKVAVLEPAHQMTSGAANSILKTLEEPSSGSLLILLTSRASSLLPTVRSRCQKITISRPSNPEALAWLEAQTGQTADAALLEFSGGGPLRALEYAERFEALDLQMQKDLEELLGGHTDISRIAAEWAKEALPERLIWLDLWLISVARGSLAGNADRFTFPGRRVHLPSLPQTLNISSVYALVDRLRTLRAQLSRTALQRELAVESWLIGLLDVLRAAYVAQRR
ncbi:hypothetical protein ACG33_07780 [Steroidobacter denitrificans]|uniref:DNA polymerase III subunit delta' n=1 Tax=Steroidobacter denitrificans TaxID=465721 RepID=A0A127F9A2_STEDE|nr:DNA polymerase III subunit delta' [Steroidobacter denitrificans]AMN46996.1 hypothetical protein ACG33_07780 [Steroidobacter denitrificans]